MSTLTLEFTFDQLVHSIQRLSAQERWKLIQAMLELERARIQYSDVTPRESTNDEAIKEVNQLVSAIRAERKNQLTAAAQSLLPDYQSDKELTAFTFLDSEDFNEAR